jgi:hypothetical protein
MDQQKPIREHLLELLEGRSAHLDLETALDRFPVEKINERPENAPHTAWELLEHLRIAQWDIVEFSRDARHVSPDFPEGYCAAARRDLQAMRDLVADARTDLLAPIPHGDGQTIFREALLVADHNAYHLGQIVFLLRILEK